MKIEDLLLYNSQPEIYETGNAFMWSDEHISQKLLEVHLNPEIDLASRKLTTINQTVEWILEKSEIEKGVILDLGCGPGLYAERFASKGFKVKGIDISKNSVEYAKEQAIQRGLDIQYTAMNYLELNEENVFDLAILIYTDLGVLLPAEQNLLLLKVYKALKPGGVLIFDVLNDKKLKSKVTPRIWEVAENGFWSDRPYLALSESFLYPKQKVILYQHLLSIEGEKNQDLSVLDSFLF